MYVVSDIWLQTACATCSAGCLVWLSNRQAGSPVLQHLPQKERWLHQSFVCLTDLLPAKLRSEQLCFTEL